MINQDDAVLAQMISELNEEIDDTQAELHEAQTRLTEAIAKVRQVSQSTLDKFPLL